MKRSEIERLRSIAETCERSGHTPTPAVRRDLMRDLRESISAQTSLLRDLEAQEAAEQHGVQRRPSEPQMRAVR
jgi:hypothetical protein